MADLFYCQIQLSTSQIDMIFQLWSTTTNGTPSPSPFKNHKDLYDTIDQTPLGDIPFGSFSLKYNGERPMEEVPEWMDASFQICYHDPHTVIHSMLGDPSFKDDMDYFKHKLFHSSIARILQPLHTAMTVPELVVYGLGPYIADYEEQVLLACMVRGWCTAFPDFPDDLDTGGLPHSHEHLKVLFEETTTNVMWDQYSMVSSALPFMYHFPHSNIYELLAPDLIHQIIKGTFKDHLVAWVYLPSIEGHVPPNVVCCFQVFLKFCYIACSDIISKRTLENLEDALRCFHHYCSVFQDTSHSMTHYLMLIHLFGAPNGLCSSITESKHIKAVKQPWQQSNRYHALLQMLVMNQWLDKLAAAQADFKEWGMLNEIVDKQRHACNVSSLSNELSLPNLPQLISCFLCKQLDNSRHHEDPCHNCPRYLGCVHVFNHAIVTFCTPSDPSNNNSMCDKGMPCYNCIFINSNNEFQGMHRMEVVQTMCFFSFEYLGVTYPCVLVHWFSCINEELDKPTGMWMVTPNINDIIHINAIFHAVHLIPIYGDSFIPDHITHNNSLEYFKGFYINCFIDHHAFDIAS
ncbi:hypothetical protein V8E53_008877 [Lactarius tabidus]